MSTTPSGFDLSAKRVSSDEAFKEVAGARASAAASKRELAAVTRDRNELLKEYEGLLTAKYPAPHKQPPRLKKVESIVRVTVGDLHGYSMDREAADAFLADLKMWKPNEIVLGGDMVDCGGFLAQHQALGYVAQTDYTFQEDIAAGNWFLDEVQKAAPNAVIHYLEGNHEDRIERWIVDQTMRNSRDSEFLRRLLGPDVLLRLEARGIHYYRRSQVYVKGLPPGWMNSLASKAPFPFPSRQIHSPVSG